MYSVGPRITAALCLRGIQRGQKGIDHDDQLLGAGSANASAGRRDAGHGAAPAGCSVIEPASDADAT